MKNDKTTKDTRTREAYEPMKVEVMAVCPAGVLCGSGVGEGAIINGMNVRDDLGGSFN